MTQPPRTLEARIVKIETPALSVWRLILRPEQPFSYRSGQYLSLRQGTGQGRSFSMARAPAPDGLIELNIRRHPGGYISETVLEAAQAGDILTIDGPYGDFIWQSADGPVVMLATGTGIAPLQAMLEEILADGRLTTPLTLYWGARRQADLYQIDKFLAWETRDPGFRFVPVLSRPDIGWRGRVGHCQDVAADDFRSRKIARLYACGNPQMIEAARHLFVSRGLPETSFHADPFEPDAKAILQTDPSISTIALLADGQRIDAAIGITMLEALKAAGLPIMSVCGGRQSCGTCLVHTDPDWSARLPPPARTERNLLSCLPGVQTSSRLACQIRLSSDLDGLSLRLPVAAVPLSLIPQP